MHRSSLRPSTSLDTPPGQVCITDDGKYAVVPRNSTYVNKYLIPPIIAGQWLFMRSIVDFNPFILAYESACERIIQVEWVNPYEGECFIPNVSTELSKMFLPFGVLPNNDAMLAVAVRECGHEGTLGWVTRPGLRTEYCVCVGDTWFTCQGQSYAPTSSIPHVPVYGIIYADPICPTCHSRSVTADVRSMLEYTASTFTRAVDPVNLCIPGLRDVTYYSNHC